MKQFLYVSLIVSSLAGASTPDMGVIECQLVPEVRKSNLPLTFIIDKSNSKAYHLNKTTQKNFTFDSDNLFYKIHGEYDFFTNLSMVINRLTGEFTTKIVDGPKEFEVEGICELSKYEAKL